MKNTAGKDIQKLSFNLISTIKPNSISRPSPKEDIVKIKLNCNPINNPVAPKSAKMVALNLLQCLQPELRELARVGA